MASLVATFVSMMFKPKQARLRPGEKALKMVRGFRKQIDERDQSWK